MTNFFKSLFDAETRPVSMTFVLIAGVFSVAINCFGAWLVYDELPAQLFFVGLAFGIEGLALTVVPGIIRDWENNHRRKAAIAAVQLGVIAVICATFGHNAFDRLSVGIAEANASELARADRIQKIADSRFEEAAAARAAGDDTGFNRATYHAEIQQKEADKIRAQVKQNQPPQPWLVMFILFVAETVKIGGRWTFATHTKRAWSKAQREAHDAGKAASKGAEAALEAAIAEALKPKRGRPSNEVIALRALAARGKHVAAAT